MPTRCKFIEPLEKRRLMAAVYPTIYEQYMVELYNWARANPSAAATKFGVALNEGPTSQNISSDAKQPLAINPQLNDAASSFAQWMIDHDLFGHYVDGSNPQSRMAAAGYSFGSAYGGGENAGIIYSGGPIDTTAGIDSQFQNYYIDSGITGRGHRVNMMNASWKQIGSGVAAGNYNGMNGLITVQDFAFSGTSSFLTGVAYTDTSSDNFYTPGEQMSGATITAVRTLDGATFSTTTWASGGYTLALPTGTYTVWGGDGTLGGYVKYDTVVIGALNVKRDFRPDLVNSTTGPELPPPPPPVPDFAELNAGKLTIEGTADANEFTVNLSGGTLSVTRDGETAEFSAGNVTSILVVCGDGNDTVTFGDDISIKSTILGGVGNDLITSGKGADVLRGDAGNDTIYGQDGADRIWGNAGNDKLYGGNQNDTLYGDEGNDSLWGQNNDDILDGRAGADYMSGGRGTDTADYSTRSAAVFVELTGIARSGEAGEKDNILTDTENIQGGSGNDRLIGSASANVIWGNGGNDSIYGNAGIDSLWGGNGNDRFFTNDLLKDRIDGGNGRDSVSGDAMDILSAIEFH